MVYSLSSLVDNSHLLTHLTPIAYRVLKLELVIIEMATVLSYCVLFFYSLQRLSKGHKLNNTAIAMLFVALLCHGYTSYLHIDGGNGQNLGLFNIFCMTTWLAMCLVSWNLLKHNAYPLLIVSIPVAAISIIEVAVFPGVSLISLNGKFLNVLHILSGIASLSIMLIAALQSLLILYLDKTLRSNPAGVTQWFGPLQGMERYLVQLLTTGFLLMSISLFLVLLLPNELKSEQAIHKVILTLCSWIVLAVLMYGRYIRGWRGVYAARWSLLGIFLLLTGYFGSKFVLEFFLS